MSSYSTEAWHPSAAHDEQNEWMSTATARRINFSHIPGNGSFAGNEVILQCALTSIQGRQEPSFKIVIELEVRPPGANCNQLRWFPVLSAAGTGSWLTPHRLTHAMLLSHFPTAPALNWAPTALPQLGEAEPLNYKRLELPFYPGDGWESFDGTISCWRDRIKKKNKTLTSSLNYGEDGLAIGQGLFCWEAWAIPTLGITQGQQQQSPGILIFHPSDRAMGN